MIWCAAVASAARRPAQTISTVRRALELADEATLSRLAKASGD
ncbi:hypothetical protein AB0M44_41300 [Streptosporangium subroseum]